MPDHTALLFGDERHAQGTGCAQGLDNPLFGVLADLQGREGGGGHLSDRRPVCLGFVPDEKG